MHKKIKFQKMIMIILSFIVAVIFAVIIIGRVSVSQIVIVTGKIDTSKKIQDQMNSFTVKPILSSEIKVFGGEVATDLDSIKGKTISYPLKPGDPVPLSALSDKPSGGQLASSLPEYTTLYTLPRNGLVLPDGVVKGDKLDVGLLYTGDGSHPQASILIQNVSIYSLDAQNIYLSVTQSQYMQMVLAQKTGQFFLMLPGTKTTHPCSASELADRASGKTIDCYNPDTDVVSTISTTELTTLLAQQKIISSPTDSSSTNTTGTSSTTNNSTGSSSTSGTSKSGN